jgi:hypothetical protein
MDYGAKGICTERFMMVMTAEQKRMLDILSTQRNLSRGGIMRDALVRLYRFEREASLKATKQRSDRS